ncbi:MAG TPA: SMP-30/gluconolactonase/LRE family protein [Spirochaetia bacterium]|nr:SMP-30/gluconolactonase/LRE family protein [Spirochaetia bacterium]
MADFEILDSKYGSLVPSNSFLEKLWTGARWTEGPVFFADLDCLLFSDIPNNRMLRWSEGAPVTVFRSPSNNANGNTRDRQGRLVTCEHGTRRVTRTEPDGTVTVLADAYRGKRLNSPNDVVVKSDGSIWFSDPPYGILTDYEGHKSAQEQDRCYVFRLDPSTGTLAAVADDFERPNGLAFSPDESILYVSDTSHADRPGGPPHIRAFSVKDGKTLTGGRVFADMRQGRSDGFRLDTDGNIWTSAGAGVHCYTPAGDLVVRIPIPEAVSNVAFGGPKRNRLFITGFTSLYSIFLGVNGVQRP